MGSVWRDHFDRPDAGTLGASWVSSGFGAPGTAQVASKTATNSAVAAALCRTVAGATTADYYAQCVVTTPDGGPMVRSPIPTAYSGYFVFFSGGVVNLYKVVAAAFTLLASGGSGLASGGTLKIGVAGTTLTGYYNGVSKATATDSTFAASGSPGMYFNDNLTVLDDFETDAFTSRPFVASGMTGGMGGG